MLQRNDDVLRIEVPDDGTEFLRAVWLSTEDGLDVLNFPLTLYGSPVVAFGFGITPPMAVEHFHVDVDELADDDEDQGDELGDEFCEPGQEPGGDS